MTSTEGQIYFRPPPRNHLCRGHIDAEKPALPVPPVDKQREIVGCAAVPSTTLLPSQHTELSDLHVDPPSRKQTHTISSDEEVALSSQVSVAEDELPHQPSAGDLPEVETVESDIGDPHVSSPSEDFSSDSQLLPTLAKTLKPLVNEPAPPEEDLILVTLRKNGLLLLVLPSCLLYLRSLKALGINLLHQPLFLVARKIFIGLMAMTLNFSLSILFLIL